MIIVIERQTGTMTADNDTPPPLIWKGVSATLWQIHPFISMLVKNNARRVKIDVKYVIIVEQLHEWNCVNDGLVSK